ALCRDLVIVRIDPGINRLPDIAPPCVEQGVADLAQLVIDDISDTFFPEGLELTDQRRVRGRNYRRQVTTDVLEPRRPALFDLVAGRREYLPVDFDARDLPVIAEAPQHGGRNSVALIPGVRVEWVEHEAQSFRSGSSRQFLL